MSTRVAHYHDAIKEMNIQFDLDGFDEDEDRRMSELIPFISRLYQVPSLQVMADADFERNKR